MIIRLGNVEGYTNLILNTKLAKVDKSKFHSMTHKQHPAIPEGYIYVCDNTNKVVNKVNLHPVAPLPRKKNRDYTIIDHFGSIESTEALSRAYALAKKYSIHAPEHTYTMKGFCKLLSRNDNTRVSDAQKNYVRLNFHPKQVIIITNSVSTVKWRIDNWAEVADNIVVIEVLDFFHIEVYNEKDLYPTQFATKETTDSKFRRCANIWGNALGWTFSAPLYRDNSREMDEMYLKRPDRKIYADMLGVSDHLTKIASRPESYINAKVAVASEQECKEFFNYYAYLYKTAADPDNDLTMKDFLEPGYEICPDCGKPIRVGASNRKQCSYCTFEAEDIEVARYFEADNYDEE